MTTPTERDQTAKRTARNANASREALIDSGRRLFSERGFENTSIRAVAKQAGVDAALIARYFGSKVNLYLATLAADDVDWIRAEDFADPRAFVTRLVDRADSHGPGALLQALVRSNTAPEIREAARVHLTRRLVEPLRTMFEARGVAEPQLRAEVTVSALIGVLLARSLGSFDEMVRVGLQDLIEMVCKVLPHLEDPVL
jgi:AcrR family transcriptional regulator